MTLPEPGVRRRARVLRAALLLAALLAAAPPAPAVAAEPTVEQLVELFAEVAFGREVEELPAPDRTLIRWSGPVRIGIEQVGGDVRLQDDAGAEIENVVMRAEPVAAATIATVRRHARALAEISGHDIRLAAGSEEPNLWVTLTTVPFMARLEIPGVTRSLLRRLAGPGRCYFVAFADNEGTIRRARVVANRLLDDARLSHCLLEELTQSLGLPNDSSRHRPSIFSDNDTLQALSETDAVLLKVLYDPLMKPGMPRDAALWRAEGLFRKLRGDSG